ncbi:MAG: DMT family transporter [Chloroflexota bacterium]|nr:DMT family transporter [Chloroflexota bacterium]
MSAREREGLMWILAAAIGFAFIPTIVKTIYNHANFEPLDLAVWRFVLAAPLMWILVGLRTRSQGPARGKGISPIGSAFIGLLFAAAVLCGFFALQRLPGSTYIVLFFTYPAMIVLLSTFLGEAISPRAWLALALALVGVGLTVPDVIVPDAVDPVGAVLALANAAIVAAYYLLARRVLTGVEDISRASAHMMSATLLILLLSVPIRGLQFPQNPATLVGLFGIATLGTVLPVFATNIAIQRIGPARASLVSTIEPVLAMVVAMILLGEVIAPLQWLGAALIVGSVVILQLRAANKVNINVAHEAG